MKKSTPQPSFRFVRTDAAGPVKVLNENSYLMAEYNQRTGKVSWQRVVAAAQKINIENWLQHNYPVA